ncbi:MAG: hypothetical protein QOI58_3280 [Thermoanaerobaculia bacterium]|jgi:hypothetical protein|nr:hypothetical protein [Thermoanaerobaculia bacterium]
MQVQQLHTRFLWPFFFGRDDFDRVVGTLSGGWTRQEPPHLYREELLAPAQAYLGDDNAYFRFAEPASLFPQGLFATLSNGIVVPVKIPSGGGLELFVTHDGVGMLAIALSVADVPTRIAVDFNYRLARMSSAPAATLHVRHPSEEESRWSRIPQADRDRIRPAPAVDAPPRDRIGKPGGTFTLAEVVHLLAEPLVSAGARPVQSQLSIYTVASFDSSVVFDNESCIAWGGPLLSALAQIEEPTHAGSSAGVVDVPNALMNRCHWAAAGMLGAAHLIADQPAPEGMDGHPFNAERMYRVRDKYFVPYLFALIQRLVLNCMGTEAAALARSRDPRKLRMLRTSLLEFGIGGRLSQISSRQALHRYYRLAQEGFDVREAWGDVRNALSDMDASNIASDVANNIRVIKRVQDAAHALEYVIISVYFAHLWHMFAADNMELYAKALDWIKPFIPPDRTLPHGWFVAWGVLLFATIGWLLAFLLTRVRGSHE